MLRKNKKRNNGFSLIELLLIVSIIVVIFISGFKFWENQRATINSNQTVATLNNLSNVVKKSLSFSNQSQFVSGTLTSTALNSIIASAIEAKYRNGSQFVTPSGVLTVAYGGLLITNAALNQNFGVNFTISNMNRKNCALLVSSDIKDGFSQIRVNNSITAQLKKDDTGVDKTLLIGACSQNGYNNVVRLDIAFNDIFSEETNIVTQAEAYIRNPDSVAYYGSIDNSPYTSVQSCSGGSSWNAATNKCGCPANSRWMGNTEGCVPFNNAGSMSINLRAGVCNLNYGFNDSTGRCEVLVPSLNAATGIFSGGKHLPSHSVISNVNGSYMPATTMTQTPVANNWNNAPVTVEEIGGRVITTPAVNTNTPYSSNCIIGTKLNNRCLPPATPPVGNW